MTIDVNLSLFDGLCLNQLANRNKVFNIEKQWMYALSRAHFTFLWPDEYPVFHLTECDSAQKTWYEHVRKRIHPLFSMFKNFISVG